MSLAHGLGAFQPYSESLDTGLHATCTRVTLVQMHVMTVPALPDSLHSEHDLTLAYGALSKCSD